MKAEPCPHCKRLSVGAHSYHNDYQCEWCGYDTLIKRHPWSVTTMLIFALAAGAVLWTGIGLAALYLWG